MLDAVLAIQEHVEAGATTYKRRPLYNDDGRPEPARKQDQKKDGPYTDIWREREPDPLIPVAGRPTGDPARDLLLFISEHAPALEDWQRDIVQIIRAEMLYFLPQMQTKICNEGWASYWHVRIMRELDLTDDEVDRLRGPPRRRLAALAAPHQPVLPRLQDSRRHRAPLLG